MISLDSKSNCCGCRACEQICPRNCITLRPDECGFLYPVVNTNSCINCDLCRKACPILNSSVPNNFNKRVYAMAHHEENEVIHSSSGGAWSGICRWGIENNYVIYGVIFDENWKAVYRKAVSLKECDAFRGSKYIQSDPMNSFEEIKHTLEDGGKVIFSGTPCYVKALRNFLKRDFDSLLTVDLICHGVPSPTIWEAYIRFLEKKEKSKIISINMRDKRLGWNHRSLTSVKFENNKEICDTPTSNTFMDGFGQELFFRPSCYECHFSNLNRPGDLTIGDFWGINDCSQNFYGVQGVSCCICNNKKGEKVFSEIQESFIVEEKTIEECMQPNLSFPTRINSQVYVFWHDWRLSNGNFAFIANKYFKYTLKNRLRYIIKNKLPIVLTIKKYIKK